MVPDICPWVLAILLMATGVIYTNGSTHHHPEGSAYEFALHAL